MIDTRHLQVFTVSKVNRYLKQLLDNDVILSDLWVKGEVSNYTKSSQGHIYFTLKDENGLATLNTVMFKSDALSLRSELKNGMKVQVGGRCSIYEQSGKYQFYAHYIEVKGHGDLYLAYEELKMKLLAEGLFESKHKKKIPFFPKTIAVITSQTGSVIKDIISVTKRINEIVKIVVIPVSVQGDKAKDEIVNAFDMVKRWNKADVIILARGGGSMEDLQPFNEEEVVRAIFSCETPVISAIGHETDTTISDFVADIRAETPSAAAEIASPNIEGLKRSIEELEEVLYREIKIILAENKNKLETLKTSRGLQEPLKNIYDTQIMLEQLQDKLYYVTKQRLKSNINEIRNTSNILESVSPIAVLKRGYSVVTSQDKIINKVSDLKIGDKVNISLQDGEVNAEII